MRWTEIARKVGTGTMTNQARRGATSVNQSEGNTTEVQWDGESAVLYLACHGRPDRDQDTGT